jgi:4-diphosphocytidyl-2-C-methyl-D-erythritol kinase
LNFELKKKIRRQLPPVKNYKAAQHGLAACRQAVEKKYARKYEAHSKIPKIIPYLCRPRKCSKFVAQKSECPMLLFSNAKINLGLHVTQRRPDGFHNIETVFFPVGWRDVVEALPGDSLTLRCTGLRIDVEQERNLCTRAFRLLQKDFGLPGAALFLHKQVPLGAGLGGGSSNAAAVLQALNEAFRLALPRRRLAEYAAQLGSDCAFFIYNTPMLATGRGEILQPVAVNLSGYALLVVKPPLSVSTAEAYAGVSPKAPAADLRSVVSQGVEAWREALVNDFEPSIFAKYPLLADVKKALYGCGARYAAMSGSGAAVFGIFEKMPANAERLFAGCTLFTQQLS